MLSPVVLVLSPANHTKELGWLAVRGMVTEPPEQMMEEFILVITGRGFTFTVAILFVVQPLPCTPVTVYVAVVPGETFIELVVAPPGFHENELAPVAVNVAISPAQMVALLTVRDGGATLIV